ncbi:unnamed protein product [Prorocentrum cordatum]|uniref:Pentatricopeptide repeat-containing protein, chloroplastic n=1 Tax=Prorocentrum cordatum TaxID=2364126 RepID=A0ABN9Y8E5_9DINO|nr:unnamed protein product [Polarella glacialis]
MGPAGTGEVGRRRHPHNRGTADSSSQAKPAESPSGENDQSAITPPSSRQRLNPDAIPAGTTAERYESSQDKMNGTPTDYVTRATCSLNVGTSLEGDAEVLRAGCRGRPDATRGHLARAADAHDWRRALALLPQPPATGADATAASAHALAAAACVRGTQWALALVLLRRTRGLRVLPGVAALSTALSGCEKGRYWEGAVGLLADALGRRLRPDVPVFNAAVSACGKAARWEEALALLGEAARRWLSPNVISYNATISACERGQQWPRALQLLEEAARRQAADVVTYNAAISACEKGARWGLALALLARLRRSGAQPSRITCNAAVAACGGGGEWEHALALLADLRPDALRPNAITCNAAISACSRSLRRRPSSPRAEEGVSKGGAAFERGR